LYNWSCCFVTTCFYS